MKRYGIPVGIDTKEITSFNAGAVIDKRREIYNAAGYCDLVRRCMHLQKMEGLSGEELMVTIAYQALVELQKHWEVSFRYVELSKDPVQILKQEEKK